MTGAQRFVLRRPLQLLVATVPGHLMSLCRVISRPVHHGYLCVGEVGGISSFPTQLHKLPWGRMLLLADHTCGRDRGLCSPWRHWERACQPDIDPLWQATKVSNTDPGSRL